MFWRLYLPILVLLLALAGGIGLLGVGQIRATQLGSMKDALEPECLLVHALVADELKAGHPDAVQARLLAYAGRRERRVTLVDPTGRVVADSAGDPSKMDNHLHRPEIVEAALHGRGSSVRRSDTVNQELLYLARRMEDGTYVRLAVPIRSLEEHLGPFTARLALATAVAALAASLVCVAIVRRHTRPVVELTGLADAIAAGDLARRSSVRESGELGRLARSLDAMADSLQRMIAQDAKDREELRTILAGVGEGVVAVDRAQKILLSNAGAARLLDFAPGPAEGRALWEVVREGRVLKAAAAALGGAGRQSFQADAVAGRTLEISVAPWPSTGAPEGAVIVAHDVTESNRYQELRKEFVANVSHELRTPLTLVKGFVETLEDGAIHDPVRGPEHLATISRHVDQLTNLVNDLLDLSRLESRPGLVRRIPLDLGELARRVVAELQPSAAKKGQALSIDSAPALPGVAGDPDYLERAVRNLVDNAIKYTPDGGRVKVTLEAAGGGVALQVEDSGIGIPAEDLPRIFERFYRVDKSRSREMGGTGLGLSIVKHVVGAHGGEIDVKSEPGQGTRFRVLIPSRTP